MSQSRTGLCIAHMTSVHLSTDTRIYSKECQAAADAGHKVFLLGCGEAARDQAGIVQHLFPNPKGRLARMTRTCWAIYRKAKSLDADIYHFHDPELLWAGWLLAREGKPVVYDVHEDVPLDILTKRYLPAPVRRFLSGVAGAVERWFSRRLAAVVAATPGIAGRFRRFHPNVVVVRNYPRWEQFEPWETASWEDRPRAVAYVGTLSRERGLAEIQQAMELLPDSLEVQLKVAGTMVQRQDRELLAARPQKLRVEVLGPLPWEDVLDLLRIVRAGLVVLHPLPQFQTSLPVKMFEYMAAGLPVVASDFRLWRELLEGTGCALFVNPLDARSIAAAIEYLLTHPQEAEEMGRRGRQAIQQKYNWNSEARTLLQLYKGLGN